MVVRGDTCGAKPQVKQTVARVEREHAVCAAVIMGAPVGGHLLSNMASWLMAS